MAIMKTERKRSLKVTVNIGNEMSPKYKNFTYNNFSPSATDEKMRILGTKFLACQTYPSESITLIDKYRIEDNQI